MLVLTSVDFMSYNTTQHNCYVVTNLGMSDEFRFKEITDSKDRTSAYTPTKAQRICGV